MSARSIATSLALALGLASAAAPAVAAPNTGSAGHGSGWGNGWNGGGNIGWNDGGGWNGGPQVQTISIGVDRYAGDEILQLRQLGNIDARYNGQSLRSVRVEVHPWGPPAQVQLLVNGQVVDAGYTAGRQAVELRPGQWDVFGQEIQSLQLRTVGYVAIDDIELSVTRLAGYPGGPGGWQPQPVCQTVERRIDAQVRFGQLSLNQLFDLARYTGCRIGSVTLIGSTAQGMGQAAVAVNGVEAGSRQRVSGWPGMYTLDFWSRPALGGNAPQVALNLMGLFNVQAVRLNLVRD